MNLSKFEIDHERNTLNHHLLLQHNKHTYNLTRHNKKYELNSRMKKRNRLYEWSTIYEYQSENRHDYDHGFHIRRMWYPYVHQMNHESHLNLLNHQCHDGNKMNRWIDPFNSHLKLSHVIDILIALNYL